jgi:hypothetical protein
MTHVSWNCPLHGRVLVPVGALADLKRDRVTRLAVSPPRHERPRGATALFINAVAAGSPPSPSKISSAGVAGDADMID